MAHPRPKRPRVYSTEFPVSRHDERLRVEIDRVPRPIYRTVRQLARRQRLSMRTLTLRLWQQWADEQQRQPHPDQVA
jgi:hypothetical protein